MPRPPSARRLTASVLADREDHRRRVEKRQSPRLRPLDAFEHGRGAEAARSAEAEDAELHVPKL